MNGSSSGFLGMIPQTVMQTKEYPKVFVPFTVYEDSLDTIDQLIFVSGLNIII